MSFLSLIISNSLFVFVVFAYEVFEGSFDVFFCKSSNESLRYVVWLFFFI